MWAWLSTVRNLGGSFGGSYGLSIFTQDGSWPLIVPSTDY